MGMAAVGAMCREAPPTFSCLCPAVRVLAPHTLSFPYSLLSFAHATFACLSLSSLPGNVNVVCMDPTRQDAAAVQPTSFMVPTQGGYQIATAPKEDGAQGGGASAMETD